MQYFKTKTDGHPSSLALCEVFFLQKFHTSLLIYIHKVVTRATLNNDVLDQKLELEADIKKIVTKFKGIM